MPPSDHDDDRTSVWVVTAGPGTRRLDFMLRHDVVVVGWSATGSLDGVDSTEDLRARLRAAYPDAAGAALDSWASQLRAFSTTIRVGDEVLVPVASERTVAVGQVTGPYRFDPAGPENRRHQIPVRWERRVGADDLDDRLRTALATPLSVLAVPGSPGLLAPRRVGRRTILAAGIAAAGVAGAAAVLQPWRGSTSATAARSATPTPSTNVRAHLDTAVRATTAGPVAQWVVDENAKPGTTDWNIGPHAGLDGDIEGYADTVSATQGTSVRLFVSTVDPSFHVEMYRLGYYGGAGGRLVWQSASTPGIKQAAPTIAPGTNMVEATWQPSVVVPVDHRFPPGVYLCKLVGSSGVARLVPLTVRNDESTAAYMVQSSVTTWQAYNDWGGYSLYKGPDGSFERRARVVSFDRPYSLGLGQSDFLGLEFPLVMLMEQLGLDVTYTTDVDTHAHPELLIHHKAYFSLGHDEYWSVEMRNGVEAARDAGVNLVFSGANAVFRQIRLDPSPVGPNRQQTCYKDASEDPIRQTQPALTTVNWRDAPVGRPESSLIGQQYESNPVRADMVIVDPSAWVFTGTGVTAGQKLSGVIGSEYDHYHPSQVGPPNVQILAHSPLVCRGIDSYADMTYYSAPSGAGVLATGTIDWIPQLTPPAPGAPHNDDVVAITKNVLAAFGQGPAGTAHPSTANYDVIAQQFGTAPGVDGGPD
jgi:hypothetical protein